MPASNPTAEEALRYELALAQGELARTGQELRPLQSLMNHLPAMVGFWDTGLINRLANQAYLQWFGKEPTAIIGHHASTLLGPELFALNQPLMHKALAGEVQHFERVIPGPLPGQSRTSLADYIPYWEQGVVSGFFVLVSDISEQKNAALAVQASKDILQASELRYRNVVMDQTEMISRLRSDGSYLFANDVFCRFFDKRLEDLMGSTWSPLVHPDDLPRIEAELAALSASNPVVMIENRIIGGQGQVCWMQFSNRGIFDADGRLLEIQSIGRDISERKQAEGALHTLNQALNTSRSLLRDMAAHNELLRESERKHVSREVHDELGQILTALRMDLLYMEMRYCALDPGLQAKVQDMKALLDQAFDSVRNVASNLRPMALDIGLTEALRWLCAEFSRKSGVPSRFEAQEALANPDEATSVVLFRIVQESLTNIARHAEASRVTVRLAATHAGLELRVQDDGVGFDSAQAPPGKCFGLLGMHERALALGGEVSIRSSLGQGCCITVAIPLPQSQGDAA